jgi:N-acyl-D-aspartate/D-glutamate deacylase
MLDLKITEATIVDGTGAPRYVADIGVANGRIVAIGPQQGRSHRTIDANGLVVTPGFIDIHTHYDAQMFWDPYCTPSPLHGVTTVLAGNCGLTLAPLMTGDTDFMFGVLSRVESIPLGALVEGIDPHWSTFGELVAAIDARPLGINVGLMAGHTALRRAAMGEDASTREATATEVETMCRWLRDAMDAGAMGFSTSTARAHVDQLGRPTPPHFAGRSEMIALAAACRRYPGTSLEFIPGSAQDGMSDTDVDLLQSMAAAAGRPINWNLLQFSRTDPNLHVRQLRAGNTNIDDQARVLALLLPNNPRMRIDFGPNNLGLRIVPGCDKLFELPIHDLVAALRRSDMRDLVQKALDVNSERVAAVRSALPHWTLTEAPPELRQHCGSTVAQIAASWRVDPLTAVLDIAVASRCTAGFERRLYLDDPELASLRYSLIDDPRVIVGGSDAGAHVDAVANAEFPTASLHELVTQQHVVGLEQLVHLLTEVPARMLGLHRRGTIAEGMAADLVLLDPQRVKPTGLAVRKDLPAGERRLYSGAEGIERVFVAGRQIVHDGETTGEFPGRLLRSGVDSR